MSFEQRLIQHWYGTPDSGLWWLHPLSWLFAGVSYLRRALYRWGGLSAYQPPVPLIVIGNLTVGGVGKTPLTLQHLVNTTGGQFQQQLAQVNMAIATRHGQ